MGYVRSVLWLNGLLKLCASVREDLGCVCIAHIPIRISQRRVATRLLVNELHVACILHLAGCGAQKRLPGNVCKRRMPRCIPLASTCYLAALLLCLVARDRATTRLPTQLLMRQPAAIDHAACHPSASDGVLGLVRLRASMHAHGISQLRFACSVPQSQRPLLHARCIVEGCNTVCGAQALVWLLARLW